MAKKVEQEQSLSEYMEYVIGRVIVAIGKGDFVGVMKLYLLDIHGRGYKAGLEEGKKRASK